MNAKVCATLLLSLLVWCLSIWSPIAMLAKSNAIPVLNFTLKDAKSFKDGINSQIKMKIIEIKNGKAQQILASF